MNKHSTWPTTNFSGPCAARGRTIRIPEDVVFAAHPHQLNSGLYAPAGAQDLISPARSDTPQK